MDVSLSLIEKSLSSSLKSEIRLAKCTKFKKKRIFRCWVADGPEFFAGGVSRQDGETH